MPSLIYLCPYSPVLVWLFFYIVSESNAVVASLLPPSCLWQLALSFYRLRYSGLDACKHQVSPAIAVTQLALLLDMPPLAWRATRSYRRFLFSQISRNMRAGYWALRLYGDADVAVEVTEE